jgi:hypothetical protein
MFQAKYLLSQMIYHLAYRLKKMLKNHAQNEQLRRSGDTGDICSQRIIVITATIT